MMARRSRVCSMVLALGLLLVGTNPAIAGRHHGCRRCGAVSAAPCSAAAPCGSCGGTASAPSETAPAAPMMVEKTIMVPTYETETRTIKVTECKPETRERTVTVIERVPKTETVTRNYTVLVPKTETKTVTYNVSKPVVTEEKQQYTVNVSHWESREGTRKVCKQVATTKKKAVTVDEGHWEGPAPTASAGCGSADACGGCAPACDPCASGCGRRHRFRRACGSPCGNGYAAGNGCGAGPVWVPNPVQKEVEYTAYEKVWEDQKYTYNVCVMKPETRERTVKKCSIVTEQQSREVTYTKCVAEQRSSTHEVTRYENVPTEKKQTYTVQVPHEVEKQVQVRVCKMVAKTVLVPAGGDNGCGSNGQDGCGRGRRCRGC